MLEFTKWHRNPAKRKRLAITRGWVDAVHEDNRGRGCWLQYSVYGRWHIAESYEQTLLILRGNGQARMVA